MVRFLSTILAQTQVPDVGEEIRAIEAQQARSEGLKSFFWAARSDYYRIGVFIGCGLSAWQQLSGVNVVVTLSNTMFEHIAPQRYATLLTSTLLKSIVLEGK